MTVTRKTETSAERSSRRVGAIAMVCAAVVMALGLAGPVARAQDLGHDPGSAEMGSMASGADMGADMGPDTGSDMGAVGTSRLDAPDDGMSDMGPSDMGPSDSGASGAAQDDGVVGLIQAPDGVPGLPADLLPPPLRPMDMDAANIASFAGV